MHVRRIRLQNIRSIRELEWKIAESAKANGWHVVIGDNGSGKSTFLRAIALGLIGPAEPGALRQDWMGWLPASDTIGAVELDVTHDNAWDTWGGSSGPRKRGALSLWLQIKPGDSGATLDFSKDQSLQRSVWRPKQPGWFSAGYGPFRRFEGGDPESSKGYYAFPKVGRHLSVFGEDVALTECLQWLRTLKHRKLEGSDPQFFDRVRNFVNQTELLPSGTVLEDVSADEIRFRDGNDFVVPVNLLGDGFRSVLSMTFELLRQLQDVYGSERVFEGDVPRVAPPGVVLIDEVDAHLHPSWQRRIGRWFTQHFPNMQFIVTTHSPLVCWSAEEGTIFRLPSQGSDEAARMVEGEERKRLVSGNVLDAYGTELFGPGVGRSEESQQKLEQLAELNQKQLYEGLTQDEENRQAQLKEQLPTTAYTVTPKAS